MFNKAEHLQVGPAYHCSFLRPELALLFLQSAQRIVVQVSTEVQTSSFLALFFQTELNSQLTLIDLVWLHNFVISHAFRTRRFYLELKALLCRCIIPVDWPRL